MNRSVLSFRRLLHRTLPAFVLFAGLSLLPATQAEAGGLPSPHELHHDVRDTISSLFRSLSRVPVSIHLHDRHLEVFLGGYEYYRPHRHRHAVYRFPVWVGDDVYYRPYSYCNGRLYGHDSHRPRLWVEWGSLHSGHWCNHCHGYFPARHGHFKHRYRDRYDRHDYDRYDRYRGYHRHHSGCGHYRSDRHHGYHRHHSGCGHYRSDRHRGYHRDDRHRRYDRDDRHRRYDRDDRHRRYDRDDRHRRHDRDRHHDHQGRGHDRKGHRG